MPAGAGGEGAWPSAAKARWAAKVQAMMQRRRQSAAARRADTPRDWLSAETAAARGRDARRCSSRARACEGSSERRINQTVAVARGRGAWGGGADGDAPEASGRRTVNVAPLFGP